MSIFLPILRVIVRFFDDLLKVNDAYHREFVFIGNIEMRIIARMIRNFVTFKAEYSLYHLAKEINHYLDSDGL